MKTRYIQNLLVTMLIWVLIFSTTIALAVHDPLSSWNNGKAKQSILHFVAKVTKPTSPDFVPVPERIAVFDNDGTLWAEQPFYPQFQFGIDRVKEVAAQHPEWKTTEPYISAFNGDIKGVIASGVHGLIGLTAGPNAGLTTDEFDQVVNKWITTARHPQTGRLYTEMVYQPMLELLAFLRANGFKTFIVSGGGIDFMRPWTERVYGIPPQQIIGSSCKMKFELRNGQPVIVRLPELDNINDKDGKPLGINLHIGRRPIAAFGNSDGDLPMLEWTATGKGTRFCLYVHHTDATREWAYDRLSPIGRLDKGLDEAQARGWTIVDIKKDWKVVFPAKKK